MTIFREKRKQSFHAEVEKGLTPFKGKKLFGDDLDEVVPVIAGSRAVNTCISSSPPAQD
jgi:hypothetical protein